MQKPLKNYAFIDCHNLYLGIRELGWNLDFKKFRIYLKEKYEVEKAYLFLGYIKENENIYYMYKKFGYELIFKETILDHEGAVKGSCDAELVLQAMEDLENYQKAILVTGDGDFACLVKTLMKKGKFGRTVAPNMLKCSLILKKASGTRVDSLAHLKDRLGYSRSK